MVIKADQIVPLQEEFFQRLEKKTSWGRNEIKDLFKDSLLAVTYGKASRKGTEEPDEEIPISVGDAAWNDTLTHNPEDVF
jgi:hypothetical protein